MFEHDTCFSTTLHLVANEPKATKQHASSEGEPDARELGQMQETAEIIVIVGAIGAEQVRAA